MPWEILVLDYFAVGDSTAGLFFLWEILMLDFLASGQMNRQAESYVKSIATYALTFFGYIISVLACVSRKALRLVSKSVF